MSSQEKIVSTLSQFGLDETDSKLYLGLLQMGSVTVGSISSKLEMDRGKVYRSLNRLRNLGLVSTTFSNPTICRVEDPHRALQSIIQTKEDEIITMQKLAEKIIKDLKQSPNGTLDSTVSSFSIIQGRSNIFARISTLIQQASNSIYMVTTIEDVLRMYHTSIPEKIENAKKNGIEVKLLTYTKNEDLLPLIDRLNASEVRIGKLPSQSRMIVEKDKQLIMSGSIKESINFKAENDSSLFTTSSEMICNMFSLCSHLWQKSKQG